MGDVMKESGFTSIDLGMNETKSGEGTQVTQEAAKVVEVAAPLPATEPSDPRDALIGKAPEQVATKLPDKFKSWDEVIKSQKEAERWGHQNAQKVAELEKKVAEKEQEMQRIVQSIQAQQIQQQTRQPATQPNQQQEIYEAINNAIISGDTQGVKSLVAMVGQQVQQVNQDTMKPILEKLANTQASIMDSTLQNVIASHPKYGAMRDALPLQDIQASPLYQQLVSYVRNGADPGVVASAYGANSYNDLAELIISSALVSKWDKVGNVLKNAALNDSQQRIQAGLESSFVPGQGQTQMGGPAPSEEQLKIARGMGVSIQELEQLRKIAG